MSKPFRKSLEGKLVVEIACGCEYCYCVSEKNCRKRRHDKKCGCCKKGVE